MFRKNQYDIIRCFLSLHHLSSSNNWTEVETDNNAMTTYVTIEEGGFGNQTGGGEFPTQVTWRVLSRMISSLIGGGGGAGMFSALEWIMKGAVWGVLVLFVGLGYRMEQRSYGRVRAHGYAGGL